MKTISLYTDGGCHPNPGPGGWAFIAVDADGKVLLKDSGRAEGSTTNNRMEMSAAINGLEALPIGSKIKLVTDSQYLGKGIAEWRLTWKARHWMGVKNDDLWRRIDELCEDFEIKVLWVKGHSGDPFNEECDRMASAAYRDVPVQSV